MPLIAATPWRRTLPTFLHPETDLYTIAPFYIDGVEAAGGTAVVVPWVATSHAAKEVMQRVDGLLLTGGPDIDPWLYEQQNAGSVVPPAFDERGITADGTVEAIEHTTGRLLGVQWHPERLASDGHHVLFDWLIDEAGR